MIARSLRILCALPLLALGMVTAFAQSSTRPQTPAPSSPPQTSRPRSAPVTDWKRIAIPPLPPFHPQEPKRIVLNNGMIIFLQEDHELPLIGGTARIRGGSRAEPEAKTGLIDIYGQVWRTGGTKTRTGDQLDDFLESRAARIETGGGADSTTISFNTLKDRLDDVFPVFLELLRDPAFREDKVALAKLQMNTGIARRNDDVDSIAGRESVRLAYGPDNPYSRIPEYATVAAITRDDLVKWHEQYVHPNNIILGISGDFDSAAMERRLRQAFETWPKAAVPPPPQISFHEPKPGVYFIEKEDVNQSTIEMVKLGIERRNPDYFSVQVMNEILGGGFASRLIKSIRTEKGLAYSVGGGIGASFDHPGIARIGMGTKSSSTVDAIEALRTELNGLHTRPVTAQELKEAKDAILNRFIFNFDSKDKVLGERMLYEFYGYPPDFLEQYRAGIEKATVEDVNRVAAMYVHPEQFAVLVVGKAAEFGKPLTALGPVTPIDITIPEGTQPKPAAGGAASPSPKPAQSSPEARALVEKFVNSIGGEAKVAGIKAIHQTASSTQKMPQGEMTFDTDVTTLVPDKTRVLVQSAQMPDAMTIVVSPSAAFMNVPGAGTQEMPASLKQDRLNSMKRDWLHVAQHLGDSTFAFASAGTEKIGDVEARVVDITGDGVSTRWFLDPTTGYLLRATYQGMGMNGPVQRTIDYSDWRPVDGFTVSFRRKIFENGQQVGSEEIKTYQVNPSVDPKLFEKPVDRAEKP